MSLQLRVLYLSCYPRSAGQPDEGHMYDSMQREFYWLHIMNNAHAAVNNCRDCACSCTPTTITIHLKFFHASGPLEFISMDNLSPLFKIRAGNQIIVLITALYSRLKRAFPSISTIAPHVTSILYDLWVVPYGIPAYLVTDNGSGFVDKFSETLCQFLGLTIRKQTARWRYNKKMISLLHHYIAEHQHDWGIYFQPLT